MSDTTTLSRASPAVAAAILATAFGLSTWLGSRHSPSPDHPRDRRWYKSLDKPAFTPPDPAFGIAWPLIEAGMAWGGYRLLRAPSSPSRNTALALLAVNTGMIGGWSELFFGQKALGASALASAGMVGTGIGYVAAASRTDRPAAAAGVPFALWVGFATLVAAGVWRRNGGRRGG
jgi:tryptophan-rich sensory protein